MFVNLDNNILGYHWGVPKNEITLVFKIVWVEFKETSLSK